MAGQLSTQGIRKSAGRCVTTDGRVFFATKAELGRLEVLRRVMAERSYRMLCKGPSFRGNGVSGSIVLRLLVIAADAYSSYYRYWCDTLGVVLTAECSLAFYFILTPHAVKLISSSSVGTGGG